MCLNSWDRQMILNDQRHATCLLLSSTNFSLTWKSERLWSELMFVMWNICERVGEGQWRNAVWLKSMDAILHMVCSFCLNHICVDFHSLSSNLATLESYSLQSHVISSFTFLLRSETVLHKGTFVWIMCNFVSIDENFCTTLRIYFCPNEDI